MTEQDRPQPQTELEKYLAVTGTSSHNTLEMLPVAQLIGGMKSNKFIYPKEPDEAPDPANTLDLKNVAVPSSSLQGFAEAFDSIEALADSQYDLALHEAQLTLEASREQGRDIEVIFIPDTVNNSAKDYCRRLTRLAQDTGVPVVIREVDYDMGHLVYDDYITMEPPIAITPEAYWDSIEQPEPYRTPKSEYSSALITSFALNDLLPIHNALIGETNNRSVDGYFSKQELNKVIRAIRYGDPQHIQEWLEANPSRVDETIAAFRHYSIAKEGFGGEDLRENSRTILAHLDDDQCLAMLLEEIENEGKGASWGKPVPLAIYLNNRPEVKDHIFDTLNNAASADNLSILKAVNYWGAALYSRHPDTAGLIGERLKIPEGASSDYIFNMVGTPFRWLSEYVDDFHKLPDSDQKQVNGEKLKEGLYDLLQNLVSGDRPEIEDHSRWIGLSKMTADMLMSFEDPGLKPLFAAYIVDLFKKNGSIIKDRSFEEAYLSYRKRYGDLPEILQHVTTV